MRIVLWVLGGVAAIALLGGVVFPVLAWLLHALGWVVASVLVVGGGVWVARRVGRGRESVTDRESLGGSDQSTSLR